jgi:hypothetical protein
MAALGSTTAKAEHVTCQTKISLLQNRKTKYAHEQSCGRVTMYNTRTVVGDNQQKAQYNKEYKIRVRSEIDNHGLEKKIKTRYHVKHEYYRR